MVSAEPVTKKGKTHLPASISFFPAELTLIDILALGRPGKWASKQLPAARHSPFHSTECGTRFIILLLAHRFFSSIVCVCGRHSRWVGPLHPSSPETSWRVTNTMWADRGASSAFSFSLPAIMCMTKQGARGEGRGGRELYY